MIEGKNRWRNGYSHPTDFELHVKFDKDNKMTFVNPNGSKIDDQEVIMPLKRKSATQLSSNYSFKIKEDNTIEVIKHDLEKQEQSEIIKI
ncbi:MAG: hypothetical protein GXP45_02635 [bacterium]|nr:hypothetical protein [bacterium]